jgi:hypothetical protein
VAASFGWLAACPRALLPLTTVAFIRANYSIRTSVI